MPDAVALSIIIVSYNTRALTLACLRSIYDHAPAARSFEIVLLDNASADGSADAIATAFPQVRLLRSERNLGFAGGNNVAARAARGDRLLLLNPDTLVLPGALDALLDFAAREPARGIWGGRTLFGDGSLNPTSCWRKITLWSLFCSAVGLTRLFPRSAVFAPEGFGDWDRRGVRDVDIVTGCFLLIDHGLWTQLGGFDPLFFMYAEEADLCLRAAALGHRPGIDGRATIIHLGGASEVSQTEKTIKIMRGRMTLIRKHWPRFPRMLAATVYRGWALSRLTGSLVASGPRDGSRDESRRKWREIWSRRSEWLSGY